MVATGFQYDLFDPVRAGLEGVLASAGLENEAVEATEAVNELSHRPFFEIPWLSQAQFVRAGVRACSASTV
jgi:hypothetical protein